MSFFFSTQQSSFFGKKPMFEYNIKTLNSLIMVKRKYYLDGHIERKENPYLGVVFVVNDGGRDYIVDYLDSACFTARQRYLNYWKRERGILDTYVDPTLNYDETFNSSTMQYSKVYVEREKIDHCSVVEALGTYYEDEKDYEDIVTVSYRSPPHRVNPDCVGQVGWRMVDKDTQFSCAYVIASDSCIGHCVWKYKENIVQLLLFNGDVEGHVMITVDAHYEYWLIHREHVQYPYGSSFYYDNNRKHVRIPRRYPRYGRKGNDFIYFDVYVPKGQKDDIYWRDRSKFYYKYPEDSRYTEKKNKNNLILDLHSSDMYGSRSEYDVNAPTFEMLAPLAGEYWDRDFNDYSISAPNSHMEMNFFMSRKSM